MPDLLPIVSAVIPSKNRPDRLAVLIDTLTRQNYPQDKIEIVVIDDGSTPPYRFDNPQVKLIRHDSSAGAQKSRNEGLLAACGQLAFILDDDIELLNNDFITKSVKILTDQPNVVAVFGKKIDVNYAQDPQSPPFIREFSLSKRRLYSADLIPIKKQRPAGPIDWSHSIFIARRDAILNIGGYDGIYGLNGGHSFREESDLQARLRKNAGTLWFLPDIAFKHHIVPGGGHGPSIDKRLFWIAHNHIIFLKRHLPLWPAFALGFIIDIARYSWAQSRFRSTPAMIKGYLTGWRNALRDHGPGKNVWLNNKN